MNCKEIHFYLGGAAGQVSVSGSTEIADHIAGCEKCRIAFEQQKEVSASLRLCREAVVEPSAELDAAVLANYRKWAAQRGQSGSAPIHRLRLGVLAGSVAVAAALLAIVMVPLMPINRTNLITVQTPAARVPIAPQLTDTRGTASTSPARKPRAKTNVGVASRKKSTTQVSAGMNRVREDFQSLMYCDELSCVGGMEVIRVQVPSFVADPVAGRSVVYADVLVGADGIARGIRIVE
jgi:hypothetical protein